MNKLFEKLIAVMLVIVLAGANLSILGMYGISYALTDAELAGQTTATGNSNVEFNAYFQGGGHTEKNKYDATTKLFVNVKVKNAGYLKNAQISFDNVNFKIAGNIENGNVQSVNKESRPIAQATFGHMAIWQASNSPASLGLPLSNHRRVDVDVFLHLKQPYCPMYILSFLFRFVKIFYQPVNSIKLTYNYSIFSTSDSSIYQ